MTDPVKKNFKAALDELPIFRMVAETSRQMGVEGYVVGGFVRDLLMKRPCNAEIKEQS